MDMKVYGSVLSSVNWFLASDESKLGLSSSGVSQELSKESFREK